MTHDGPLPDSPVTPEEAEAARLLAEALEGGDPLAADPEALSAARLIASVSESTRPADEVAPRRLRRALVAEASRTSGASGPAFPRRGALALAAAAAVAAGLLLPLLRQRPAPADEALLAERERAARAAVASLAGPGPRTDALAVAASTVASARSREIWSGLSEARLESLGRELAPGGTLPSSGDPEPTPGGRS